MEEEKEIASELKEIQTSNNKRKKRISKPIKKFPNYSLVEALRIPTLIKENNGGNPWNTDQVALALGVKKGGNTFYYMTAASRDYGFTKGTRDTNNIELEELGRKRVYAQSEQEINESIKEAFFRIELFKKVYEYYNGNEPSDPTFFKNALFTTFNIDESFHDDFIKIYKENMDYIRSSCSNSNIVKQDNRGGQICSPNVVSEDKKLFVIMPFSEKTDRYSKGFFNEVFKQLIEKSAQEAGYIAETADRDGSDIIHSTIIKEISSANIILADLTEHNPNVLFELGLAIALSKPVVLIKTECTGQIFDIDNTIRVFSYNPNLWTSTLKDDVPNLAKRIKSVVDNIGKDKTYLETFMGSL